jgi:hypothetical protein
MSSSGQILPAVPITCTLHSHALVFVVGAPRSGTTLAARILGRHSRIFMPGETDFFDDIYSRRRELGDPQDPKAIERIIERLSTLYRRYNHSLDQRRVEKLFAEPSVIDDLKTSCRSYRDVLSFFMALQMCREGKVYWGNNVPRDIFNVKEIFSFYPHVKVLVCVRDVRDFLLSYKNLWKVASPEHVDREKKLYHPIVTSLLWKSTMRQVSVIESLIPPENLMIVRYESLVENPEETVRSICRFVQVEFEGGMLEVTTHNSSFQGSRGGIFTSSVGRWREGLAGEEVYLAQQIGRRELERFGYTIEKITANPAKLASIAVTLPYAFWRALDANKTLRGPLFPYLVKRTAGFLLQNAESR